MTSGRIPPTGPSHARAHAEAATSAATSAPAFAATSASRGMEFLVDAVGCDPARLASLECLRETCEQIVSGLALRVLGEPQWVQFPAPLPVSDRPGPGDETLFGGVTGLYLLAESHLTCHTFPEHGLATFNLYCCRRRAHWDWSGFLQQRLGATEVVMRSIARGASLNGASLGRALKDGNASREQGL